MVKEPDHKPPQEPASKLTADANAAATDAVDAQPEAADAKKGKPKKILAEKYFDTGLYGTVSYFGQAAASVLLTQWIQHGSGKQKFAEASKWVGHNLLEKQFGSTPENAAKQANTLLVATTLIMVGNCFLGPVKYMENHKPEFVRKINDWLNDRRERCGETVSLEERKEQDAAIAHIAEQPRQTWGSLISARAFSLGAIYAAIGLVGGKNNKAMEEASAQTVSKVLHTAGVSKQTAYSKPVQDFGRIAFVDFAYSLVGAGALYLYSHTIAPPKHKKKSENAEAAPAPAADIVVGDTVMESKAQPAEKSQGESWKTHLRDTKQSFVDMARSETQATVERV